MADKFAWLEFVLAQSRLSPMLRLVATRLFLYADVDGGSVRPGTELVAVAIGISTRQVWRHIEDLRRLGLVVLVARGGGRGRRTANEYRLSLPDDWDRRLDDWTRIRATRRSQGNDSDTCAIQTACDSADTRDTHLSVELSEPAEKNDTATAETTDTTGDTCAPLVAHHQSDTPASDQPLPSSFEANGTKARTEEHPGDETTHDGAAAVGPLAQALAATGATWCRREAS